MPHTVYRAAFMWMQAANISTVSYPMLTTAAAHVIREHASPGLAATYLPPMLDGRWYGTMNLSEPGIGSALGDLKTSATQQADGSYRIRGEKMWISGGEHELSENIVHLVLARTGGPGTKGRSLFIVPRWLGEPGALGERNDISLVGLNHKMGYRGTVNTALSYGSGSFPVAGQAGAVGYLEAAGDVVVAWLLLDQLLALAERHDNFAESKRLTVRFFITHVLPRADPQLDLLASGDALLISLNDALI